MADLTLTATSVVRVSGATEQGTSGATLTAGMGVYKDPSDALFKIADCTTSTTTATLYGIALNGASTGQPVLVQKSGTVTIGATIVVGGTYVLSTAGKFCPIADLTTADKVTYGFYGATAANATLINISTGIAVP